MLNEDYAEMLRIFTDAEVRYLLVGAYAMGVHGHPRATGDIDLLVEPSAENSKRVYAALVEFGAPTEELTERTFSEPDVVFQIGVAPRRIDIVTSIDGVAFEPAYREHHLAEIGDIEVPCLSRDHLIQNKRSTGRPQDVVDADTLEQFDE
jgi:hypothetical protein